MCLRVFAGVQVETLLIPDTFRGAGTTELNVLDVEKPVLYRQWELPTGKTAPAPPRHP